ncbi:MULTISPECIES: hypothetical protein [unclassified Streptomyces]|uniref:Uncharacterized protein n=1 Tax=Streptomyces sp. NBC_00119 TaxID=2975659 RepID=A0AAU1UJT4_9ACTN|nr:MULTISPECIES: hypothetical protein [unclassified Streptomyces]MCX4650182.1 hypothetical protein [Streptomyces sp. NBC_01446]MCX5320598.1 hypothetical protein [Streptomyces sp. NBC_00120]
MNNVLARIALGQLIVGVLGVLVVTGEYASGAIRSTLAAVPNRPLLLAAKAGVFGTVTLILGELVAFAPFFAGRLALSDGVPVPGLGDPGVLRAVVLSGAYLAMVGLLGIALGARRPVHGRGRRSTGRAAVRAARGAVGAHRGHGGEVLPDHDRRELARRLQAGGRRTLAIGGLRGAVRIRTCSARRGRLAADAPGRVTAPRQIRTPVPTPGTYSRDVRQ